MGEEPDPTATVRRAQAVRALAVYWPKNDSLIFGLPIVTAPVLAEPLPPRLEEIALPEWAADLAPERTLPVPVHCVVEGQGPAIDRVDWLGAAWWYLNGDAERAYEQAHGPIHSYSFKLKGWPRRMWDRAWANRIALFLRRWAARQSQAAEADLFGALPKPRIMITHDVDAVRKTWSIRGKQSLFQVFNGARRVLAGDLPGARTRMARAVRFALSPANYQTFDELLKMERAAGIVGHFMVYGRAPSSRTGLLRLLDPDYDVMEAAVASRVRALVEEGVHVGLHPSFHAWDDSNAMEAERLRLERACGAPVTSCRQHWLKFSWARTWRAQQRAGLTLDMTLGFNDRPGFRNGAALRFSPWDQAGGSPVTLESVPLVLMDSHLYDYAEMNDAARAAAIQRVVDEVVAVRGTATVLWHPHTLSQDYGWQDGFRLLLHAVSSAR
jgi:hypothetical protein